MTEELQHEEGLAEPEDESLSGVEESGGEETETGSPVSGEDEVTQAAARLAELEQTLVDRDTEIAELKRTGEELTEKCNALGNALAEAVAGYKEMVVQANPEVIGELIEGDTIESINKSLEQAKTLVSKVRQGVEEEISLMKVPAGAPERTPQDLSALSPREKIRYAIGGNE